MSNEKILHVTDADFEEKVLKASGPVLVDYWAPWCGPCKMIAPLLDSLVKTHGDKMLIVKVNIDENQETPSKHGVRGIPTLMIFKDGEVVDTKVGMLTKPNLEAFVDGNI